MWVSAIRCYRLIHISLLSLNSRIGYKRKRNFQIEQCLRLELPCLRHVMLVGQEEDYVAALMTLHTDKDEEKEGPGQTLTEDAQRWFRHAR